MTTLHIENTVRDFDEWKAVFDKFDRFRTDHGVRAYRLSRGIEDPSLVNVDLEFDTAAEAIAFREALAKVRATPQSQAQLVSQRPPMILETVA